MQNGVPPAEAAGSGKGRTKKIAYAEVLALREKRREERRDRPKSAYKGVSWDKKRSLWHVQLWTGSTVSLPTCTVSHKQTLKGWLITPESRAVLVVVLKKGPPHWNV